MCAGVLEACGQSLYPGCLLLSWVLLQQASIVIANHYPTVCIGEVSRPEVSM